MAYIRHENTKSVVKLRQHIYRQLLMMAQARTSTDMRIETLYSNTQWTRVQKNLQEAWSTEAIRAEWYKFIHDIVPTNVRLSRINLSATDRCRMCGCCETLINRLTVCAEMKDIWDWTRTRITMLLPTDPLHTPPEWTTRQSINVGPPERRAILWILAHMVYYSQHKGNQMSLTDFADFLRRVRWKTYQRTRRHERVGKYLMLL